MQKEEIMLKVENVSKVYKLGEIGGTTLRDELQRLKAKILHKEDPTKRIGTKGYNKGEKFKALDNISFEVKKGERIGIIGHNGAGKSTLLKLISRVTGPTDGKIYLNGRVASMLEVGTGFHPELTGRENIYMNGAILGMTKKEIDTKMEDIIEFSEVRQFIDTPVKRYSSGMYVKLAFSVAAHLDSEIMIMDEVLAVGDVAFQNKCLKKMRDVSEQDDRTILYVSHNMSTIRQLCSRVIVLNHGVVEYDGSVENGIAIYSNLVFDDNTSFDLTRFERNYDWCTGLVKMSRCEFIQNTNAFFFKDKISLNLHYCSMNDFDNLLFRMTVYRSDGLPLKSYLYTADHVYKGFYVDSFTIDTSTFVPGKYYLRIVILQTPSASLRYNHDYVDNACSFIIKNNDKDNAISSWLTRLCGNIVSSGIDRTSHIYLNHGDEK